MKYARSAIILVAIIVAAAFWVLGWPGSEPVQQMPSSPSASGWQQAGAANPFAAGSASGSVTPQRPDAPASASIASVADIASTSLAGTQADGDWGVSAQGQLRASRALRQRFDYYLSLTGEMPLASIEALLQKAAQGSLKEPALGQVLGLWRKYVQLQQHSWQHAVDVRQSTTWSAALTERQIVRRQILGADWAHAFYAAEDSQLQEMILQVNSPSRSASQTSSQTSELTTVALHPQASEREAALQAQWQQWEQRLEEARGQLRMLRAAPELSEPQRQQALERYLSQHFQGTELIRARALLGG